MKNSDRPQPKVGDLWFNWAWFPSGLLVLVLKIYPSQLSRSPDYVPCLVLVLGSGETMEMLLSSHPETNFHLCRWEQ